MLSHVQDFKISLPSLANVSSASTSFHTEDRKTLLWSSGFISVCSDTKLLVTEREGLLPCAMWLHNMSPLVVNWFST